MHLGGRNWQTDAAEEDRLHLGDAQTLLLVSLAAAVQYVRVEGQSMDERQTIWKKDATFRNGGIFK